MVPSIVISGIPQVPFIEYIKYFLKEDKIVTLFAISASLVWLKIFY